MKRIATTNLLACFVLNLLINIVWTLPAVALFILRVWFEIPLWIPVTWLSLWAGIILVLSCFICFASSASQEKPVQENKNPYSVKSE